MSALAARRFEMSPAALGSVVLHAVVAAAFMISWSARELESGSVVPVTIVNSAPDADTRPAEQGPDQEAMTEAPAVEAPPEPAAPPPQPAPAPTPSKAKPAEKSISPTPTKPAQKRDSDLNLDDLYASLTKPARNAPQRPSAAQKGPSRAETAATPRDTTGFGRASGTEVSSGLQSEFERNWSIDCSLAITRDTAVRVYFTIGAGGRLTGNPTTEVVGGSSAQAREAAEFRARQAVSRSEPAFAREPRQNWGKRLYADFNARDFCG